MKFIHTADWHLGKRLSNFSLHDQHQEALERLVEIVQDERPDAVVVAGDVFDAHIATIQALSLWEQVVGSIVGELEVPLIAIPGNHDHPERLSVNAKIARRSGLHLLKSVRTSAQAVEIGGVHLFGLPFHKPARVRAAFRGHSGGAPELGDFDYDGAMRWLVAHMLDGRGNGPAVLVGHAFVDGVEQEDEGEDAIGVGGAGAVSVEHFAGFDYVALGHIHSSRALDGDNRVRYSGSLYPCSFAEAGSTKSVEVVELSSDHLEVRQMPIPVERQVRVIEGLSFEEVLTQAKSVEHKRREDYLLVRITDDGPIDHAIERLREVYPHAILEQPQARISSEPIVLRGDAQTIHAEGAFEQFYQHVFGEPMSEDERALLQEILHEEPGKEDTEPAAAEETY